MFRKICLSVVVLGVFGIVNSYAVERQLVTSEVFEDSGEFVNQNVESEYSEYADAAGDVMNPEMQNMQMGMPQDMQNATLAQSYNQFYDPEYDDDFEQDYDYEQGYVENVQIRNDVPAWPLAGSDADVTVACGDAGCAGQNNAMIVTKIGDGLVVENSFNLSGSGWSGGPDIVNNKMIPAGFDYECANGAEMPLMNREMMEDDGGTVLAMSRSGRKHCDKQADNYAAFAERAGFKAETCDKELCVNSDLSESDVSVNLNTEAEAPATVQDQVRSWVVVNGQTLREVLKSWCDKEGWDLVWTTSREYPIEASAVFKGRFVDVASALIRNFERATPIPYAKFYKGNRVIVVSTNEE